MGGTGEHCLTSLTKIVIASVSARTLAIPRVYAIAVLLLSIVLMFKFVAKVYESLILHNGARLKYKEVLAMARSGKIKKVNEEENA